MQKEESANGNVETKKKNSDPDKFTVQITVPPDGGWGWVVLFTASFIHGINDGIMFTYGNVIEDIKSNLKLNLPLAALINSLTVSSYFGSGPLVSGLINRFGFRFCAMLGAAIAALANLAASLIETTGGLLFFSGIIAGFGYSMANMSAMLILGFYFEKWRALAFTTVVSGASTGIFLFGIIYGSLSRIDGWRITLLLQASLLAIAYFAATNFRPLLTVTVEKKIGKIGSHGGHVSSASRLHTRNFNQRPSIDAEAPMTQRIFKTQSNANYPTVAEIINEPPEREEAQIPEDDSAPGPSNEGVSKLQLIFNNPDEEFHHKEIEIVKSMAADKHAKYANNKNNLQRPDDPSIDTMDMSLASERPAPRKRSFWKSLFHWEKHVEESRPMYRDDVFYEGSVKNLHHSDKGPTFNKSLEYQLEVSRAAAASDLNEHQGVFTTAFRRVLATMLDPHYLKRKSFLFVCIGMFFVYLGYLIPPVYVAIRGKEFNIPKNYHTMFVSCIGIAGIFGRIVLGYSALKLNPLVIAILAYFVVGLATLISCFLTSGFYQLIYCFIYGFLLSGTATIRSLYLANLYGLDHLTNCTGIVVIFQGVGCLLSTPIGGVLREVFNFKITFIFAAVSFFMGSLCHVIVYILAKKDAKLNEKEWKSLEKNEVL